tara:strand:+ start:1193 stop:1507 length:315 start_codon:yes stop_codon:yes gene_type:complete
MLDLKPKSPISGLADALETNMKPKAMVISSKPMLGAPMGAPPGKHDHDREMVLNRLRSINRMSQILEEMACGCEPMPSWAEAKIYSSAKDLQGVLGYLLGDKPI